MSRRKRGLVENASSHRQIDRARDVEARAAATRLNDLREVLSSRAGRRFVWRLLEDCGIYRSTFREAKPDVTAFLEGQRALGLQYFAEIQESDVPAFQLMEREHIEDVAREQATRDALAMQVEDADDE